MKTVKLNGLSEWRKDRDKLIAQINFLERAAPNDFVKLTSLRMELIYAFRQIAFIRKRE